MRFRFVWLAVILILPVRALFAQQHYFVDGYHGGIYGHYPAGYTQFIVDQLQRHPAWKIGLEIEPETWDTVRLREPAAYETFKRLFADQSASGRIEYVNPAYGQAYLFNISGESIIRQLHYGMKKLRTHFPEIVFDTYASEEPCFTSALPQLLRSFGFKYASLKNPNTCWGGYTRAFGGELVQWQGPDGTRILTVPRYASEALEPRSTWQTTGWSNNAAYINSALAAGITNPVGMCLQDAGWRNGPWLQEKARYVTWRDYIGRIADPAKATVWPLSQEDIQVSLVWGAQVLQRIAQQVRQAENNLVAAEKYATMRYLLDGTPWPQQALEVAWSNLLLAQHHDSWIVPYNRVRKRATWADQVRAWTGVANEVSDSLFDDTRSAQPYLRVVNTTAAPRREWVRVPFPVSPQLRITDADGNPALLSRQGDSTLWWLAQTPAMGFSTYRLQVGNAPASADHQHRVLANGRHQFRTDLYELEIDPARGGVITSLKLLQQGGRQLVDTADTRGFNELRGYDYDAAAWRSSMDTAAVVTITSQGGNRSCVEIKGTFAGHPFTQQITLANGERRIDMQVRIDWQGQPSFGAYSQQTGYVVEDPRKAFYNDSCKLQLLFPVQLKGQRITKDAPFDVRESRLSNTFFSRWDSIRNNIILHWIDVTDAGNNAGMTIFSDHTSSYVHGENYPPGLTLQYAGRALWGMQYGVDGATEMQYAILPHAGNWQQAGISREEARWTEPLKIVTANTPAALSFFSLQRQGWQVTAMMIDGTDVLIRLYNAAGGQREQTLQWNGAVKGAMIEELDGQRQQALKCIQRKGMTNIRFSAPPFGVRTLRLKNVQVNS